LPDQRNQPVALAAALFGFWLTVLSATAVWAGAPEIVLPEPLAVELPAGASSLGLDDAPIRQLIASARAEGYRVTLSLPRDRVGAGVWRVIWSAWDDATPGRPVARHEMPLFVLPHGMTAVGGSGGANATAGNNTAHILHDAAGFVHMVWYDSFRPTAHEGALYRRARVLPDGSARFETDAMPLGDHAGTWSAMPALAGFGDTIHFAWQADGTIWYRSLTRDGSSWIWSDEIDTKVPGPGRDTGPAIVADAHTVHILSPAGIYARSSDGGRSWRAEPVPFGTDQHVKTVSLALDSEDFPLAAASSVVLSPPLMSEDQGHGGYWTIRLMRLVGPGKWEVVPGPVDGRSEWAAPLGPTEDVLCDWVRVLEDRQGGIHLTWHGGQQDLRQ
jgi:hypothetical protein